MSYPFCLFGWLFICNKKAACSEYWEKEQAAIKGCHSTPDEKPALGG